MKTNKPEHLSVSSINDESKNNVANEKKIKQWIFFSIILFGTYLTSFYSYIFFHTIAELFSIIIAGGIFIVGWNSRKYIKNSFFLVLGISSIYIAFIDLIHTFSYKGMNIFVGYGSNLPTQLWISARFLQACSIIFATVMINKKLKPNYLLVGYTIIDSVLLILIFANIFPVCYIEGVGLTPFKIYSEYVIITILLCSIIILNTYKSEFNRKLFHLVIASIIATILEELAFTQYVGVYDFSNLLGHIFKIVAFFLLYKAIVQIGIEDPFNSLFRQLKTKAEELEKSNIDLKYQINERKRADEKLKQFISNIAHELRTPITVIDQSLTNFIKYSEKLTEEQKLKLKEAASRHLNLLSELVEDLLMISKLDAQKVQLKWTPYSPYTIIYNTVALLEPRANIKDITIILEVDERIQLYGDPKNISQLFRIFLDNAIKYSREKSEIFIKAIDQYKGEFNSLEKDGVLFQIIDSGIGIRETEIPYLFDRFYRSSDVKDIEGTGLGLSIAKEIITLHMGEVYVKSAFGKGTTFYVFLPRLSNKTYNNLTNNI